LQPSLEDWRVHPMPDVIKASFVIVEITREEDRVVNYAFASHRQILVTLGPVVTFEDANITVGVIFIPFDQSPGKGCRPLYA